jgi:NAD(P)H-dependent FMN reductase
MGQSHKIVAISGSIREVSSNTYILKALAAFIPKELDFIITTELKNFPSFNPDGSSKSTICGDGIPKGNSGITGFDYCTSEYTKGVPRVLQNALEWLI